MENHCAATAFEAQIVTLLLSLPGAFAPAGLSVLWRHPPPSDEIVWDKDTEAHLEAEWDPGKDGCDVG